MPEEPLPVSLRPLVVRYLGPEAPAVALLAAFLIATTAAQLAGPLLIRRYIDLALHDAPGRALGAVALAYLGTVLGVQAITIADTFVAQNVGWRATNRLRADLFRHCLSLDLPFHHEHPPGVLV